ncbi:MAG TPA: CHRD domain-containing protein, partial [Stellaceae bacterium]|nr:CHRD domain-containing protein [Stellaceae bacterium]
MRGTRLLAAVGAVAFVALWGGGANAGGATNADQFSARLSGFQEVGGLNAETGAILTDGTGTFQLDLDKKSQTASYKLTFSNLTSAATMAHIHFGKTHVPGGIMVWLCQTAVKPSPVAGTPFCPTAGGSVSGTITAASVIAVTGQNIPAMSFAALEDALLSDTA